MVISELKESSERNRGTGVEGKRTQVREREVKLEEVAIEWVSVGRRGRGLTANIQHITDQGGCVGYIV